jgi:hypothetical protein
MSSSTETNQQTSSEVEGAQPVPPVPPAKSETKKQERRFPSGKTAEEFRTMMLPKKEPLIEGLLWWCPFSTMRRKRRSERLNDDL